MSETEVEISVLGSLFDIEPVEWDACACPEGSEIPVDPFTTYRFLAALERSGSVGPGTGWQPQYLTARADGQLIAVAPMFAKGHSQGEYVFDHNWAHAFERAGGRYYPKLQLAVPFTPVAGHRFLTLPNWEATGTAALVQGATQLAANNGLSSLHITFCSEDDVAAGIQMGLLHRTGQQFHWSNADYETFAEFLATLSARKRKNIRRERAQAQAFGGEIKMLTGDEIQPEHWDAFWVFYQDTGARKWGTPYLTRAFFNEVHETMRSDVLLCLATIDGKPVAGALNFVGRDALFGRYWGCIQDFPCLHFEVCYYQAIDYAIKNKLSRVEAGAQGSHKLARGYLPVTTHSLHWMADEGFQNAVSDYLVAEREAVSEEIEVLTSYGPFKTAQEDEHD